MAIWKLFFDCDNTETVITSLGSRELTELNATTDMTLITQITDRLDVCSKSMQTNVCSPASPNAFADMARIQSYISTKLT